MILSILGPQGSGKGTQAHKLVEKYNLHYLDIGNMLREIAKNDPAINEVINKRGELLSDKIVFDVVNKYLETNNITDNILFDGYPRSVDQYNLLSTFLTKHNKKLDKIIFLTISDDEAIRRLSARRIHKVTGEIYNLITNPPTPDINLADLEQRPDDQPQAIAERLRMYHEQTQPLINHFKTLGIVIEVDGTKPIDEVFENICEKLG